MCHKTSSADSMTKRTSLFGRSSFHQILLNYLQRESRHAKAEEHEVNEELVPGRVALVFYQTLLLTLSCLLLALFDFVQ